MPAAVCSHCGEEVFSRDTIEQLRLMPQEEHPWEPEVYL
ncbi:MAG: YgiT-type zinc finger protein [Elainella sp. Prado103]|nr:YgiT-type zinc finger protein [Elainella sp. Prado103]